MGLFDRLRGKGSRKGSSGRPAGVGLEGGDEQHLRSFATSRQGVEAFVEPRTTVTDTTLLLVAADGEWTRRIVPTPDWAYKWARKQGIPVYDAAVTGLPARMREYNRRKKIEEQEKLDRFLDGPAEG